MNWLEKNLLELDYPLRDGAVSLLVQEVTDRVSTEEDAVNALSILAVSGQFEVFDRALDEIQSRESEDIFGRVKISRLLREGRYDDALEIANPTDLLNIGQIYEGLGRWQELLILARELMIKQPGNPWGPRWLSKCLKERGDLPEKAEISLRAWFASEVKVGRTSFAQYKQDDWVLNHLGGLEGGYFVELGGCDGVFLSNTLKLEHFYNWNGLLIEPSRFDAEIAKAIRLVDVDVRGVGAEDGGSGFLRSERGPMADIVDANSHSENSNNQAVEITTLSKILDDHDAPEVIDFISLDIEGRELEALGGFDFSKRTVKVWCIEHNYGPDRRAIRELMVAENYIPISFGIDDFFVKDSHSHNWASVEDQRFTADDFVILCGQFNSDAQQAELRARDAEGKARQAEEEARRLEEEARRFEAKVRQHKEAARQSEEKAKLAAERARLSQHRAERSDEVARSAEVRAMEADERARARGIESRGFEQKAKYNSDLVTSYQRSWSYRVGFYLLHPWKVFGWVRSRMKGGA